MRHGDYKPVKLAALARAMDVSQDDYQQFKNAIEQLQISGKVVIGSGNLITLPSMGGTIIGTFRANPKGFGFVCPLEPTAHGDLFIPPKATADAMTGDIVSAKAARKGMRAGQMRYTGKIVEILERANNKFVGTLAKTKEGWLVQPDGKSFVDPISVDDVTAKNAHAKDKVLVEILNFPSEKYLARGVILEVLGKAGRYQSEIKSIIHQFHLPEVFDQNCIKQARAAAVRFKGDATKSREDISDKAILTIDPPDAKDFDDAISLEKDKDGNWVLGVHIADVSSFIPADSPLDKEAKFRGNSVYLPAKTIPMLPEVLSNGVCSLQPDQKRYVKSAYITYDDQGNILNRNFANSIITSSERLTYLQADKILNGHPKGTKPQVVQLLKDMKTLSRLIEKRRRKNGMLHLDLPETELIMDKAGRVVDARPADDCYPHTIIEMFMVEANDAVADLLDRLNAGFMRRIHPEPDSLTMKNLSKLVKTFGLKTPRTPDRHSIQNLLAAVKGQDCSLAVNLAVLQSFEKAVYSPLNVGHFALASRHYCHFTSPIRRYADLLVHRALEQYLHGQLDSNDQAVDLTETAKHISFTEQRAEDAERELKTVLLLQMLSKKIGGELDCVITGVAGFGIFVRSKKYGIEGLITLQDLGPDEWDYKSKNQAIYGVNSGKIIHLGMKIKVRIVSVNVPGRQLNVCPVTPLVKAGPKQSKKAEKTKRSRGKKYKQNKKGSNR